MSLDSRSLRLCGQCLLNALLRRAKVSLCVFLALTCLVVWRRVGHLEEDDSIRKFNREDEDWREKLAAERQAVVKEHISFYVDRSAKLFPIPRSWTGEEYCPACFGLEMCDAIERRQLKVHIPPMKGGATDTPASRKGVFFGAWRDAPIVVKRLSFTMPVEFSNFDQYVCRNVTGSTRCSVASMIVDGNSPALREGIFQPEQFRHAWRIAYPNATTRSLAYALCMTEGMINEFFSIFGAKDGLLADDHKAMLFTSMIVQPESLMLRTMLDPLSLVEFMERTKFRSVAPRFHGACGRLTVVANAGRPLSAYINASLHVRAKLALQLLSMVDQLWHSDPKWFALYTDFQYENVAVSHDDEVLLVDFEDLSVVENTQLDGGVAAAGRPARHEEATDKKAYNKTCNAECFADVFRSLTDDSVGPILRRRHCARLHGVSGDLMYVALCRNILSDLPRHRRGGEGTGPVDGKGTGPGGETRALRQ